jgi:hypothetical protein
VSTPSDTRDLILPSDLCERVSHWHGGQSTACYSLCSTGLSHYVSAAMVEAAADELDTPMRHDTPELRADREDLVGELRTMLAYPEEHRAE